MEFLTALLVVLKAVSLINAMNKISNTTDKVQCTRCGKDVTGWSNDDFQTHIRVHLMNEIRNKYPQVFKAAKEIETKYGARLIFEFND